MHSQSLPTCNICGTNHTQRISNHKNKVSEHIYRCTGCELRFVYPLPDNQVLKEAYDGLYANREKFDSVDEVKKSITRKAFKGYLRHLKKLGFKGESFLDLGGGLGYYAEAAKHNGFNSALLDLDQKSTTFAHEKLGIDEVYNMSLVEFLKSEGKKFDVVFFRHVIEHVSDPQSMIVEISKCLNKGGVLILETPNNTSVEIILRPNIFIPTVRRHKRKYPNDSVWKYIGKRIYALRSPIHLSSFRNSNLELLLEKNSLKAVSSFNYLIGDTTYWPNQTKLEFKMIVKSLMRFRFKAFFLSTLDVLFFPCRLLLQQLGYSSGICIYAKKLD